MYSDLIEDINERLIFESEYLLPTPLILDDTIISNKNSVNISVSIELNDEYIEQFVFKIKEEILRALYKFIFKEMKSNNKFIDLRNLKFTEKLNRTSLFLSQFKYKNLVSCGRLSAELQDSLSFHFSKMKTNPWSGSSHDIYKVGKYLDFEAYVDPYLKWDEEMIYLFNDIRFNINNFQYEVRSEATFQPKLVISYDFYFEIGDNEIVYIIDDEFQKSLPILLSQMRDEKIDKLLNGY
jgi:hypothetical protein